MIDEVRLVPEDDHLEIEFAGDLAGILALTPTFFSRWFSSSSCFSRFISDGINPPYFLRQA